jgi:hypothetical protein
MKAIKFRRPYFRDEDNLFSHFSYWGVKIDGADFTSPSVNNKCYVGEDMQFIGLFDINEKPIFEGTILISHLRYENSEDFPLVVIQWNDSECCFIAKQLNGNKLECPINWIKQYEIIGSSHENPELLIQ